MLIAEQEPTAPEAPSSGPPRRIESIAQRLHAQEGGGFKAWVEVKWRKGEDGVIPKTTVAESSNRTTWGDAMAEALTKAGALEASPS